MEDLEERETVEALRQLLKERLMSLTALKPESPRFQYFLEYDVRAVERGKKTVASLNANTNVEKASLLDIGCGTGGFAVAFALAGARVVGLDTDSGALKLAVVRARAEKVPVDFMECDGMRCPFPDSSFDIIICNEVFEHVDSKEELAHEIARLLKKAGTVYIRVPNKLSPWNILWDDHTGLPFFTLLPRSVQDVIIRITGLSPTGMPCALNEPTYGSLKKIFSEVDIALKDDLMREDVANAVFLSKTDMLTRSRSNRYPALTTVSLKILKLTHDICKLARLSDFWWFLVMRTYPILTFTGTNSTYTASSAS